MYYQPFDVIDPFKGRGLDVHDFYARDVLYDPVEAVRDFSNSNPVNIVARESNEGPLKERDILDDNDDIHLGRELLDDPREDLLVRLLSFFSSSVPLMIVFYVVTGQAYIF